MRNKRWKVQYECTHWLLGPGQEFYRFKASAYFFAWLQWAFSTSIISYTVEKK